MILLKFGKKEHLEQLKSGSVHFRPVEYFQNEPTTFRGGPMEGKLYLDPTKPLLINGYDISSFIQEATISHVVEGNTLSFSASKLSRSVCHMNEDGTYTPNDDFIAEMSKFGDSFLVFNGYDLIEKLRESLAMQKCPLKYHSILYCNKRNPEDVHSLFADISEEDDLIYYFIKDIAYSLQNEWRMVLFDVNNLFPAGENGGVNIETGFTTEMPIFKAENLRTLKCSDDYLFD